jgi:hypothetical protein
MHPLAAEADITLPTSAMVRIPWYGFAIAIAAVVALALLIVYLCGGFRRRPNP